MRWLAALLLTGTACAGLRDPETPDEDHLRAGSRWSHVTCEVSGDEASGVRAKGSGVAIAPQWVLTAAHVTAEASRNVSVRFADGSSVAASRVIPEPRFSRDRFGEHDLALVRLARPLSARRFPAIAAVEPGRLVHVAGFGMYGKLDGNGVLYDGRLRAGNALVRHLSKTSYVCVADKGECELLYCPASGDSGGPLFDADGNVVGIHSYTARLSKRRRGEYGEESYHTNVSLYREWICNEIADAP